MPRPARPYPHRGHYVTDRGGTRHKLCAEDDGMDVALEKLGELLKQRRSGGIKRYDRPKHGSKQA